MRHRGYLIGIEGVDAVGKQTQSALLQSWLSRKGYESISLSFPDYDTPIGRQIKAFLTGAVGMPPRVRHLLFAANRWEKEPLIKQKMHEDMIIVANRYTESNFAYGVANHLDLDWLMGLETGMPKTDLVVVLDVPLKGLTSRRPTKDSYEKDFALQTKARAAYRRLAPRFGWHVIDATGTVEEISDAVIRTVEKGLKGRKG